MKGGWENNLFVEEMAYFKKKKVSQINKNKDTQHKDQ